MIHKSKTQRKKERTSFVLLVALFFISITSVGVLAGDICDVDVTEAGPLVNQDSCFEEVQWSLGTTLAFFGEDDELRAYSLEQFTLRDDFIYLQLQAFQLSSAPVQDLSVSYVGDLTEFLNYPFAITIAGEDFTLLVDFSSGFDPNQASVTAFTGGGFEPKQGTPPKSTSEQEDKESEDSLPFIEEQVTVPTPAEEPFEESLEITEPREEACSGCTVEGVCLPVGSRIIEGSPKFCSSSLTLSTQKLGETSCSSDYECLSNSCQGGVCAKLEISDASIIEVVKEKKGLSETLEWLKNFFHPQKETILR